MNRIPGPLRERPLPSPLAPSKLEPRNYMYMYVCIRVFVWFVLFVLFWLFRLSRYLDIFRYSYATLCYARLLYATPVTAKTHIHTYTHTYTHMHTHSSILSFIHTSSKRLLNPPLSPPPQQITVSFLSHPLLTPSPGPDSETPFGAGRDGAGGWGFRSVSSVYILERWKGVQAVNRIGSDRIGSATCFYFVIIMMMV